ncbi:SWIM zinc finger family protein [Streptomyces sp. A7024]|uniref:SWIM zinc finger family protein n=1 Tax=Streptomyces coryli TaxID=1128680 RepID=A0A6G4UAN8_9ACTN|nr:SWIM zinc finger family protein [Streptomyces coryli]NGN69203.1 SWIM zinc finger family protein [Streptomyces coryli]
MNQSPERWTADQVLALAPDTASQRAGSKLSAPAPWSESGAAAGHVWGQCKGSGSKPYQVVVDLHGPAYKCSCPSRKFPCKHALGLLLLWAEAGLPAEAPTPPWAAEWLDARRDRAERKAAAPTPAATDPAAARRRADLRLQRIAAGAAELEQRLADLLRDGLADAPSATTWEETAARMIDAQAPGLAARVRELAALPTSVPDRPARLLEECSLLHLLSRAFLTLDHLPPPLAATVRTRVGLTTDAAQLLESGTIRDTWLILSQTDQQDPRLTTRRIWLRGTESGRMALLLSYGAAGRAPELALPTGLSLDADLAYYPGAHPLRATLGTRHDAPIRGTEPPGEHIDTAIAAYATALTADPWLDSTPTVLTDVIPIPGDDWQVADHQGEKALPVNGHDTDLWRLLSISGGRPVTLFGELGHEGFRPLTTWYRTEAAPL